MTAQRVVLAITASVLMALLAPAGAGAYIYVATSSPTTQQFVIQRAPNTGGTATDLMPAAKAHAVAVDATNLYYAEDTSSGNLAVQPLSGGPDHFIGVVDYTKAIVPIGATLYLADSADRVISRINTDGSSFVKSFIATTDPPWGLATDGTYLYWSTQGDGTIARARIDGTGSPQTLVTGLAHPGGVAVSHGAVYWVDDVSGTIGRANLDGTLPQPAFISGANGPIGLAALDDYLYWTNFTGGTIGRAKYDGSGATESFVTGLNGPFGIAVDERAPVVTPPCTVPRLIGKTLAQARAALKAAHCRLGKVKVKHTHRRKQHAVISAQRPKAGTVGAAGLAVAVTVNKR